MGGAALRVGLAGAFAAAWHLGLWLVVVAMTAGAVTLAAAERLGQRALAQRAAAWALYAPSGSIDGSALEAALAADLAAAAVTDTAVLDRAIARAERTTADPWVRSLATERLERAKLLAARRWVPGPSALLAAAAAGVTRLGAAIVTASLALGAAATRHHLFLVPLALSLAVLAIAQAERRRRGSLPRLLCDEARTLPPGGRVLVPEPAVVASLGTLTTGRARVLTHAEALVATTRHVPTEAALVRLAEARRASGRCRAPSLTRSVLVWAIGAAAFVAAVEVAC